MTERPGERHPGHQRGRQRGEIRADADIELAIDALHGAVFYRLLLSGEPLGAGFTERLARQVLEGIAARGRPRARRTSPPLLPEDAANAPAG